jgi:hypothetical protein
MFGFTAVSGAELGGVRIVRLGNTKMLVSLNVGGPPGRVDHFAIGIPRLTRESIKSYLIGAARHPYKATLPGFGPEWSQRANLFSDLSDLTAARGVRRNGDAFDHQRA